MYGVFFDLSRAFDSLQPEFVRDKLFRLGIRGPILEWLLSFLTGRTMRVAMTGAISYEAPVGLGVAQGSIIGPLIFLLFINDLPEFMSDTHLVIYADDTSVAVAAQDTEILSQRIERVVNRFNSWCTKNRIMLYFSKTAYINFHARRQIESTALETYVVSN